MDERKLLARTFSTPAHRVIPVTRNQFLEIQPLNRKAKMLTVKALRFHLKFAPYFRRFADGEISYEEALRSACRDANLSVDWATSYLKRPSYKKWEADRIKELEANQGLTQGYVVTKMKENIETGKLNLSQRDSLNQAAERVWPKVNRTELTVEKGESFSMDELAEERKKVDDLEQKLIETAKKLPG